MKESKTEFKKRIKKDGIYVQCPDCMSQLWFRFKEKVKSGDGWYGWCHGDEFTCENTCDTKLDIEHVLYLLTLQEQFTRSQSDKILKLNKEIELLEKKIIKLV